MQGFKENKLSEIRTIARDLDVVNNTQLTHLYSFKQFPAFMGCVTQDQDQDLVNDMNFYISKETGMIQINPVLPLEVVYQSEHNPGTTGQSWLNHHKAFSNFLMKYQPNAVYEIGGAHGILSQFCQEAVSDLSWTIIDPNPIPIENLKATIVKGFYTGETVLPSEVDMIVHSHLLEHIYDPANFFKALSTLRTGTKLCFSVPSLKKHLAQKFTNVLNFEHTYFCTEEYIDWWLGSYGFDLLEKEHYENDHSIFYAAIKTDINYKDLPVPSSYDENLTLFIQYLKHHEDLIITINSQIQNSVNVYLFGAHIFSQFLLAFGLDRSKIISILDNNPAKQNKRLYGSDLWVDSPAILKDVVQPVIILRSGVFNSEIKRDILENINPTAVFLE